MTTDVSGGHMSKFTIQHCAGRRQLEPSPKDADSATLNAIPPAKPQHCAVQTRLQCRDDFLLALNMSLFHMRLRVVQNANTSVARCLLGVVPSLLVR